MREHVHREQLLHVDDLAGGGGTRVGRLRSDVAEERVVLGHFNRGEAQELLLKMVISVQLERDLQGVAEGVRKAETTTNGGRAQGEEGGEGAYHLDSGLERGQLGGVDFAVLGEKRAEVLERDVRFRTKRERARGRDRCR